MNRTCDRLLEKATSNDDDLLAEAFAYAIGVFYNNTGAHTCYDINRYALGSQGIPPMHAP